MTKLFTALEAEKVNSTGISPEEAAVAYPEMLAAVSEMEIEHAAIEADQSMIEDAKASLRTMGKFEDVLTQSLESDNGGISTGSAAVLAISMESICDRLGYNPEEAIVPATESFDEVNDRPANTTVALEGVKETAAKVLNAVRATIKALIRKVVQFVQNFGVNGEKLAKAATVMKSNLGSVKGDAGDAKLPAKYVKALNGGTISSVLDAHASAVAAGKTIADSAVSVGGGLKDADAKGDASKLHTNISKQVSDKEDKDDVSTYMVKGLAGAEVMKIAITHSGKAAEKNSLIKISFSKGEGVKDAKEGDLPSTSDMQSAMDKVTKINSGVSKGVASNITKAANKLDSGLASTIADIKKASGDDEKGAAAKIKYVKMATSQLTSAMQASVSPALMRQARASKLALAMAKTVVSAYGAKKKDKKDDKKDDEK